MTVVVLTAADDARGFRLAGVEAVVCGSAADVERALATLIAPAAQPALALVAASVYRIAPARFDAVRASVRWPIVVVLQDDASTERPAA